MKPIINNFNNMTKEEIKEMYLNELKHLYHAEKQLEKSLSNARNEMRLIKNKLNNL